MQTPFRAALAVLISLCIATPALANVIVGGTRVVYQAKDGEVTVRLTNDNNAPALIEAWVDAGDEKSTPDTANTPFVVTPPLFRMEPHKEQSLRILATANQLPQDRESVFWLNVLEVPPKPNSPELTGKNLVQFAFRSRLKLFYRPATLQGDATKAPAQLTWKVVKEGGDYALVAHNPSPFHITITTLTVQAGGKSLTTDKVGMVDPMGDLHVSVPGMTAAPASNAVVSFDTINDYGSTGTTKSSVSP
ncbi:fimbria/pilus periplasmic chaperone [Dyella sp. C11]|uniref:fimbrial biogenesis chaperone n=1 Tax=Dyella sp. C11 TaxID=2126991 RepID=UPI000D64C4D4|nr:fimbria/pilus periplasmic chaperone [Dyella sp. C11]